MQTKFINSSLKEDYIGLVKNAIQIQKIEKTEHPKFFAFRIQFIDDKNHSLYYHYLDVNHRNSDLKILQELLDNEA
jgi:hypothetical protein